MARKLRNGLVTTPLKTTASVILCQVPDEKPADQGDRRAFSGKALAQK
ncbi:hypothetical protein [Ensifer adhaerens]|nr:hypothetical protein [Ensifer adhaerens]